MGIYTIAAIKTTYRSIEYKSRLEARTAIFFYCLGLNFEYEPKYFEIEKDFWYVPDFYLEDLRLWIEIKGPDIYEEARKKAQGLCQMTNQVVEIWCGSLGVNTIYRFYPGGSMNSGNIINKRFTDIFSRRRLNVALRVAVDYRF